MDARRETRISKYLSRHLRHDPGRIGISLDPHGWVDVDVLIAAAAAHGFTFSHAELIQVVRANDKQRFAVVDGRIRANQGHTVPVDLGLPTAVPPEYLFHGTVARYLPAIRAEGLRPMHRHAVHLSPDRETALRVGARRGTAVVLSVHSGAMHRSGREFRLSVNGVWLVDHVPASFLRFPG
ncbi:RNA 2'-phosphotransferase [Streptomyces sp. LX-29]|uniref:RNA 2'-phosphotransferase n=1 Tax=Streptomyces sp. LX-29 TaxID=2900152 RepID=UPI00240DFF19|nr:RNA 2'-phosphotransferase [Streptomyces sp. LX-29]WFB05770.1 RNA 2'-phosphotransferase [Streptomyces sp. LX-29]